MNTELIWHTMNEVPNKTGEYIIAGYFEELYKTITLHSFYKEADEFHKEGWQEYAPNKLTIEAWAEKPVYPVENTLPTYEEYFLNK